MLTEANARIQVLEDKVQENHKASTSLLTQLVNIETQSKTLTSKHEASTDLLERLDNVEEQGNLLLAYRTPSARKK